MVEHLVKHGLRGARLPRMTGQRASEGAPVRASHPRSFIALLSGYEFLRRRADADNVERLRSQLGCSPDEARRLYALAREQGFGGAYETVFGAPPRQGSRRPTAAPVGRHAKALRSFRTQRGHRAQPF